ncbi:flagellar hook capping FlgD N-terminal domain-containing protein [Wenxinia saemankumensis]|uniref:Basal-body rod modification protein FlgD n=1 Tax=Wenxinia saemankumensis TaxID=1447782 RepID=A0A1M6G582_9RHOB|nr:flagellar hook capping FlgD N-terminal domain-containing protein [Wenxinia saemankumensis]SHJ05119.1 flagellar basal-body rod modification protein FlgD [Wenxinia saemankumensis]
MQTSPIGTAVASSAMASPGAGRAPTSSDFEMFLKMLTAQMTNQDPLEPIDSADYAVQLATFSSVEQQVLTNDLLRMLSSQMSTGGMAQYAGWVGQEVRAAMPGIFDGTPITISPNPAALADRVDLVVRDAAGEVVQTVPLPVSADPFDWTGDLPDGTVLPPGTYDFTVESRAQGELVLSEPAEIYQEVREVQFLDGDIALIFGEGVAALASTISAIRQPRGG